METAKTTPLAGVLAIVHTPFRDDESLDELAFQRQIDWPLRKA